MSIFKKIIVKMSKKSKYRGPEFLNSEEDFDLRISRLSEKIKNCDNESEKKKLNAEYYGLVGEKEVFYELKKFRISSYILHDIRIQYKDRSAQIDFIVITNHFILVMEVKYYAGKIKINKDGNFERTYTSIEFGKDITKGMYNPVSQNEEHLALLKEMLLDNKLIRYMPVLQLVVFANSQIIIDKELAPQEIKEKIVKADRLNEKITNLWKTYREESYEDSILDIRADDVISVGDKRMRKVADYILNNISPKNYNERIKDFIDSYDNKKDEEEKQKVNERKVREENNQQLIKELKQYRVKKSIEKKVSAYIIFKDKEMKELIDKKPITKEDFLKISGFGEYKYKEFGEDIIKIVKNYRGS